MGTLKTRPRIKLLTRVAEIAGIASAIVAIVALWIQVDNLKEDKRDIYIESTETVKTLENIIHKLRSENFLLRHNLEQSRIGAENLKVLYGKVSSTDNTPLADVRIEAEGGSQVYSNSNGEFLINCRIGQLVKFEKQGFKPLKVIADGKDFHQYRRITLKGA